MNEKNYSKVPVFENGLAQPVFPLTDGKTGEKYDPATSSIVRYCVYVETDYDVDGDGKRDLVKAVVQVPRSAVAVSYTHLDVYKRQGICNYDCSYGCFLHYDNGRSGFLSGIYPRYFIHRCMYSFTEKHSTRNYRWHCIWCGNWSSEWLLLCIP